MLIDWALSVNEKNVFLWNILSPKGKYEFTDRSQH